MKNSSLIPALALSLCFLSLPSGAASDSNSTPPPTPIQPLWEAKIDCISQITISVNSIVAIALHPYLLNGETLITELTIDTTGNNTIRFYYIHPDEDKTDFTNPESIVKSARKKIRNQGSQPKADNNISSIKFPEGAYAHSIEYQIDDLNELLNMHKSVISVWEATRKKRTSYEKSEKSETGGE